MRYRGMEIFNYSEEELKNTILQIKSPKTKIKDIYSIIAINKNEYWAIVALSYREEKNQSFNPCLAIRWFTNKGFPTARGYPTWFVIPNSLVEGILNTISIPYETKSHLLKFLANDNVEDFLRTIEPIFIS